MFETRIRPPRLRTEGTAVDTRHATRLELCLDPVFVVAVVQLAHGLHDDLTWTGVLGFVALSVPAWGTWISSTFYAPRFGMDDVEYRLLTTVLG